MSNYAENLISLIEGQVDTFIAKVMKDEYTVVDGESPIGEAEGTGRIGQLMNLTDPRYSTPSYDDGTTKLFLTDEDVASDTGVQVNNNPKFPKNIIDRLKTPFDYIERILLQDFSQTFGIGNKVDGKESNYFTDAVKFTKSENPTFKYGVKKIELPDRVLEGEFFVDSFTYTPFIDYSLVGESKLSDGQEYDSRIGIYADEFLTDYNKEKFDGEDPNQVDKNRNKISSNLFKLRNLANDIYAAKIGFRDCISSQTDAKAYIYAFCEHLAELFAKLSNIRMCHEIYGFKHPHGQWEGILALDIWYQMLYHAVDAQYPFDMDSFNKNPMSRYPVLEDGEGKYIECEGGKVYIDVEDVQLPNGLELAASDDGHGYALVWNPSLWNDYDQRSKDIASSRIECTTPRGVLTKVHSFVYDTTKGVLNDIHRPTGGWTFNDVPVEDRDFDWFKQEGKVYSDKEKSAFTKYANLHIGRAYEVMSERDYQEKVVHRGEQNWVPEDGSYKKDFFEQGVSSQLQLKQTMLDCGYDALYDAFCVLRNEHVFNIFNSNRNEIEVFNPANKQHYSQSQCAIVLERVFSRLYKYLQFKSTTGEVFQRHVNIDSGYKYLDTETILKSDNCNVGGTNKLAYYDESLEFPYLAYLAKLNQYAGSDSDLLGPDEKKLLRQFVEVVTKGNADWVYKNWELCPICDQEMRPRDGEQTSLKVQIETNLRNYMVFGQDDISVPLDCQVELDVANRPKTINYETDDEDFQLDLQEVRLNAFPSFTHEGTTASFELLGYSTDQHAQSPMFPASKVVTKNDFPVGSNSITLYAVWKIGCIVKFSPGDAGQQQSLMLPIVVERGVQTKLKKCAYSWPTVVRNLFTYHHSDKWTNDVEALNYAGTNPDNGTVGEKTFVGWKYVSGEAEMVVPDEGDILVQGAVGDGIPVIELVAQWDVGYNNIKFKVDGDLYCEVLIDKGVNKLVYPRPPLLSDQSKVFRGWDMVEGSFLNGEVGSETVICGPQTQPVVDGEAQLPVICRESAILTYDIAVNARIAEHRTQMVSVTFKYMDEYGVEVERTEENVKANSYLPSFHIHQKVTGSDGTYAFRYWRLASGNITSSMTVMSDLVLVAVYDKIGVLPETTEQEVQSDEKVAILEPELNESEKTTTCPFYASSGTNADGIHYCTYKGISPLDNDDFAHTDCPYLKLLNQIRNGSDFNVRTLIEIGDIQRLLKILFKVNIDIAHREYYLKVDIPEASDWWYGYEDGEKWISFEPTVEFKFSNFHASNQVENGRLLCTASGSQNSTWITPVNRELLTDAKGKSIHYSDLMYYYDYRKSLLGVYGFGSEGTDMSEIDLTKLSDSQPYYSVQPLHLYENSEVQSPVDVNGFVKRRLNEIQRSTKQLRTFTSIVKKYRPIVMPNVRDIFDDCVNDKTKYEVDKDNDYGVFGWCSIPSKTMVNMEYNEESIVVPSSYDHHNRIGGSNFLQMDKDFANIYKVWEGSKDGTGHVVSNIKDTWYYLYNKRDWTYFLLPFFNIKQNNEVYTYKLDTFWKESPDYPTSSDHLNGVIFEPTVLGRQVDATFGDIANTCGFLAKYHHNENNLNILSRKYTNLMSFSKLKELTASDGEFNSTYGSEYANIPDGFKFPFEDWIDDFDKTGSFVDLKVGQYKAEDAEASEQDDELKYKYNLGQAHAIDDFDEDSVWFYITMTSPVDELEQVIELQDIMPFVFWWENRGRENNGPTVDAYGRMSNAKLNYEQGGWCYSGAHERCEDIVSRDASGKIVHTPTGPVAEERWHAVQHTLGVDFSKKEYGGTILTTDNSGNVYKGAFDPHCTGTDEKWKIHNIASAFGTDQHVDLTEDKYHLGHKTHGDKPFANEKVPSDMNEAILASLTKDPVRPMTWNLWNVVRHYAYIRYFKNRSRKLLSDVQEWQELERYTRRIVKGIYRTFQEKKWRDGVVDGQRATFSEIDESTTNYGETCTVHWTNSFVEIQSILDRNAREHDASFVLFTGQTSIPDQGRDAILAETKSGIEATDPDAITDDMAWVQYLYEQIRNSTFNFRVVTLNGVDEDKHDGMIPREWSQVDGKFVVPEDRSEYPYRDKIHVYQGFKFEDMPSIYVLGDTAVYNQIYQDTVIPLRPMVDIDVEYPEAEYFKGNSVQKWIRRINQTVMNRQIFPVYTSMEGMSDDVHDLTDEDLKGITFQVVPQFYWKYEWSYNRFMIHRVGKLATPSDDLEMYDMLGNVWEWVRDCWSDQVRELDGKTNPIVKNSSITKVIKGGAFDQLCRKVISPSREPLEKNKCMSKYATQANVGFRPALEYTNENTGANEEPVDLFFLYDASASQDSQIKAMIESSKELIRMFAGDSQNKDVCHVGSALFLGPSIRLMCSKLLKTETQNKVWWETTRTFAMDWHRKKTKHPDSRTEYWFQGMKNPPQEYAWVVDEDNSKYIVQSYGNGTRKLLSAAIADYTDGCTNGSTAGSIRTPMYAKFSEYRSNVWMAKEDEGSRGVDETFDYGEMSEAEDEMPMGNLSIRDGSSGVGGGGGGCFKAGTLVATKDGFANIEDIKVGDMVESVDEETQEVKFSAVAKTFVHDVDGPMFSIAIGKKDDVVECTGIHKFMVQSKGENVWRDAQFMRPGDVVVSSDGTALEVTDIKVNFSPAKVYNIEVDGNHNYCIGKQKVLVHNKGYDDDDGPTYYPHLYIDFHLFQKKAKTAYYYCGVPAWKESSDDNAPLHFGEIPAAENDVDNKSDWGKYLDPPAPNEGEEQKTPDQYGRELFKGKFDFYTYDITEDGINSFQWPFTVSNKGVLSNWWAGCEPVCETLSVLLQSGLFYGYPYHNGIGYLFRKNVKKLVFVFSNEFDNSMTRTYDKKGSHERETVVLPRADSGKITMVSRSNGLLGSNQNPYDPYCVRILYDGNDIGNVKSKLTEYMKSLGFKESSNDVAEMQSALQSVGHDRSNLESIGALTIKGKATSWGTDKKYNVLSTKTKGVSVKKTKIKYQPGFAALDLNRINQPFGSWDARTVVTDEQMRQLKADGWINGIGRGATADAKAKKLAFKYWAAHTIGFYLLRHKLLSVRDTFFNYMFTVDANAPTPLYQLEDEENATASDKFLAVSMAHNADFFNGIGTRIVYGKDGDERVPLKDWANRNLTFANLRLMNSIYQFFYAQGGFKVSLYPGDAQKTIPLTFGAANHTQTVFGDNPFRYPPEKMSIMIGFRGRGARKTIKENKKGKFNYMVGMPIDCSAFRSFVTSRSAGAMKKQLAKYIKTNVWGKYANTAVSCNSMVALYFNGTYKVYDEEKYAGVQQTYPSWMEDDETFNQADHPFVPGVVVQEVRDAETQELTKIVYRMSNEGREWLDLHVCPIKTWWNTANRGLNKLCKHNLTEQNCQLFAIGFNNVKGTTSGCANVQAFYLSRLISAEGFCPRYNQWTTNSFAWDAGNVDEFVTITYRKKVTVEENGELVEKEVSTGNLKIIVMNIKNHKWIADASNLDVRNTTTVEELGYSATYVPHSQGTIKTGDGSREAVIIRNKNKALDFGWSTPSGALYNRLLISQPITSQNDFRADWRKLAALLGGQYADAKPYCVKSDGTPQTSRTGVAATIWNKLTTDQGYFNEIADALYAFYKDYKTALPFLLGYRYHDQIFSKLTNYGGNNITDYETEDNNFTFKVVPVMEVKNLKKVFDATFKMKNFKMGGLKYTHCVIDLDPLQADYVDTLAEGKFPMKFMYDLNVNAGDEYKKSKIVLQMVKGISDGKETQFTMGSHALDYSRIDDPDVLKYASEEAIVDGARADNADVTLGNGGGDQRNSAFYKLLKPLEEGETPDPDEEPESKYKKKTYFFIDPFELTIAQWCYAHGYQNGDGDNKTNARANLVAQLGQTAFNEIERSYWEYLSVWELDEWLEIRNNPSIARGEIDDDGIVEIQLEEPRPGMADEPWDGTDEALIDKLVSDQAYNPLEDTRPYYHATYDDVRGTEELYETPAGSNGANFVLTPNGDEYQMNSRTGLVSFMDILNNKVAVFDKRRSYIQDEADGGKTFDTDAYNDAENQKEWISGSVAGLNFDLPTEAQWEYCCRLSDDCAFPVGHNLGSNFEERSTALDTIAWYKYKVIGALPEPEKFCTWRISRMLFGITKDPEQVNNVYETTDA